jgi:hypothetical protein
MKLRFKDVKPNPYRDLKGNPLLKEKIAELVASINTTGFWDNCVCRKAKNGDYELAYGHHRVQAAIETGLESADFIVKDLSDALMIQIMDNENREAYQSSPASVIESVKAVVAALADASIPTFEVDPKTNTQHIRYAPSYVLGKKACSREDSGIPYTTSLIARFLGRAYADGRADRAIEAALTFLHLKELGSINNSVLVKNGQPISSKDLHAITTDIKKRTEAVQERQGKTAAELEIIRAKQLEAQAKAKADEKKAEEDHKALVRKLADAKQDEDNRKQDALAKQIKDNDERAKAKEALNKERMKELDKQLAAKKEWEAQQQVQDAYMPIRRDVEAMLGRMETIISERNPFREDVKSLSTRKGIKPKDKVRLREAAVAVADWYNDWVAPQFAPELKAAQKRAVVARKATQRMKGRENA